MNEKKTKDSSNNLGIAWRKLREIWATPRGRAIILLCIYGIFITFVLSGVRGNIKKQNQHSTPATEEQTPTVTYTQLSDLDNYEYDMKITKDDMIITYQGKHADQVDLFIDTSNNNSYYLEQGIIYQIMNGVKQPVATPISEIDILRLNPETLQALIDEATLDYTKNYASGIEEKQYILSLPAFMRIIYASTISSNEIVTITTSTNENNIQKITLDLSGYSRYNNLNITNFTIDIDYKNVGKVESFYID